jgi:hypothetical protein
VEEEEWPRRIVIIRFDGLGTKVTFCTTLSTSQVALPVAPITTTKSTPRMDKEPVTTTTAGKPMDTGVPRSRRSAKNVL